MIANRRARYGSPTSRLGRGWGVELTRHRFETPACDETPTCGGKRCCSSTLGGQRNLSSEMSLMNLCSLGNGSTSGVPYVRYMARIVEMYPFTKRATAVASAAVRVQTRPYGCKFAPGGPNHELSDPPDTPPFR